MKIGLGNVGENGVKEKRRRRGGRSRLTKVTQKAAEPLVVTNS